MNNQNSIGRLILRTCIIQIWKEDPLSSVIIRCVTVMRREKKKDGRGSVHRMDLIGLKFPTLLQRVEDPEIEAVRKSVDLMR